MKKVIIIAVISALVICGFIYFVSRMTPGSSVIKRYSYSGDVKDFISHVQSFSEINSNVVSKITDTTGTAQKGYTFYLDIELKNNQHDILYSIACESNSKNGTSETEIELVMAYDKINKVGGYRKEAKGIKQLVNYFDTNFLTLLRDSQNIKIVCFVRQLPLP
jgi:hypothetical protein